MRENDVKQIAKAMRLKFLGLTGRDTNKHWTVTESVCFDDAPEGKIHVVTREGKTQHIKQPTELLTNLTMKLINLQAVQGNDLALRLQTDLIEDFQKQGLVDIVGQRIDETSPDVDSLLPQWSTNVPSRNQTSGACSRLSSLAKASPQVPTTTQDYLAALRRIGDQTNE